MAVLLISPAGTGGWRANEEALAASLERLGVKHEVRRVEPGRLARLRRWWWIGAPLVARRARRELHRALDEDGPVPEAVIAVNSTAAMRFPFLRLRELEVPVAIRIDCPAGEQYPGRLHALHRWLEGRALGRADLVLTMGPRSSESVRPITDRIAEVPTPIAASFASRAEAAPVVPQSVVAYAGQPDAKGLDRIAAAWSRLGDRRGNAVLTVTGIDEQAASEYLAGKKLDEPAGVRWAGELPREGYLEMLIGATAFVSASRLEGHGIAQLEALAAGVPLVTTLSAGAYEAEPLARELAEQLVVGPEPDELADAIEAALTMPPARRAEYSEAAAKLVAPYARDPADQLAGALNSLGIKTRAARAPAGARKRRQSAG